MPEYRTGISCIQGLPHSAIALASTFKSFFKNSVLKGILMSALRELLSGGNVGNISYVSQTEPHSLVQHYSKTQILHSIHYIQELIRGSAMIYLPWPESGNLDCQDRL